MTSDQLQARRAERAAQGSRRQRDVDALAALNPGIPPLPAGVRETDAAAEAWGVVAACLLHELPDATWRLWLEPLVLVGEADDAICLQGPQKIVAWTRRRYGGLVGGLARELTPFRGAFIAIEPPVKEAVDACL